MLLSANPQAFRDATDFVDAADLIETSPYDDYPPVLDQIYEDERRERADMVRQAQAMIGDAIDMVQDAVRGTELEDHTDAYVVAHLRILASSDHGYVSRDTNLDDVIRQLEGREDEEGW